MKIKIYTINKKDHKELYNPLIEHYQKVIKKFAKVEVIDIFNNEISKAQDISPIAAQESYTKSLTRYIGGFSIVLDPKGKMVDSFEFANLLKDKSSVTFFIGGAFGFEEKFIKLCNKSVSFGKITISHKLIKVVLLEQIFRGLSIINNHPYHK
ncbi:MAG: 23S rRNA (pseudouridine(1915)-N(3))-methyltransferase RlmH [Epsilonproteobacteria bacterium]|nr:23S rRNA (pseudouridine(1915)-N(3))-methyltransferase RlmH [Campylobacterota bacterium]